MREDIGFGPERRRPRLTPANVVVIVTVVALIVLLAVAEMPSGGGGNGTSLRGWHLNRRMPVPGLLPSQAPQSNPAEPVAGDGTMAADIPSRPSDAFALTVTHVFDGDTIEARAQTPNDVVTTADPIRIRLIGVDTPEGTPTPECWADEARLHLAQLLPEGSTVWAAPDSETWDDYGRRLFNLWTDDGRFVNYELVAAGDAEAIRVWPNVALYDLLNAAQAEAEASGAGQWGSCA